MLLAGTPARVPTSTPTSATSACERSTQFTSSCSAVVTEVPPVTLAVFREKLSYCRSLLGG
jgi:hypothetical protein